MMKRVLYVFLAGLMLLAVSCGKNDDPGNEVKYGIDGKTPLPKAVDLGTVVNGKTILWASFNLGASNECEYGDYFAWGETEAKSDYSWATYSHANGAHYKLIKYCADNRFSVDYWDHNMEPKGPDGYTSLLLEDDAARVRLGGEWRIPSSDEIDALLKLENDPEYIWDTSSFSNENGENGVHGIRITRKSTGATIFIPAAGRRIDTDDPVDVGSNLYYWSSDINDSFPTDGLTVYSLTAYVSSGIASRCYGLTIRPVCSK